MARLTAQEYVDKQARNLKNSLPDIRAGIARVTEAPGAQAAQKVQKMRDQLLASIDDGTWERNTAAVTLQQWKDDMLNKGVDRISQGIDNAKVANVATANNLLAAVDAAKSQVDVMPSNTLDDSVARMTTFVRLMAESRGKIKA